MNADPDDERLAERHAHALLAALGRDERPAVVADHPAVAWRRAGLMAVTGNASGPGLVCPVPLTAAADGALAALRAMAPDTPLPENGALLLGERARIIGLSRNGAVSPNRSCHLLAVRDGRIALSLPRADDWALLPALFGEAAEDWNSVARLARAWSAEDLVARARLLGLAVAHDRSLPPPLLPFRATRLGPAAPANRRPIVADLSALWAGPLASALLKAAGARVIKVESSRRPDGARAGNAPFFDLLNDGKELVSLDFTDPRDVRELARLIARADIVIEASRPRALRHLGIFAEREVERGATWISITAHGRSGPAAELIGYGDDAAVAGGLAHAMAAAWGEPLTAGDAIADPLTGITAALAGWASWLGGGGQLIALALSDVVAHARRLGVAERERTERWQMLAEGDRAAPYPPRSL